MLTFSFYNREVEGGIEYKKIIFCSQVNIINSIYRWEE